eukprot:CAMPEP_0181180640 /NCGR_PEP_ID=MMETSP1096-20121128/6910_1 /TAXON_ID=156174 ORGANISM="Chrysochromulina ericina, Strain CCMP281" /NCGR_SAMPLE_ID=MMETSP1096 /ASSEMBLY_ACC=CAM_ASM_000453 /LENGTH=90 /DNA_ID=CAMNT_0023269087 /DNA_START=270 /DNA_END=542 /DNA_ORIENTATION=-
MSYWLSAAGLIAELEQDDAQMRGVRLEAMVAALDANKLRTRDQTLHPRCAQADRWVILAAMVKCDALAQRDRFDLERVWQPLQREVGDPA